MDEDLKIVLTSELEADEQASAQRISAQLPNIARLINSRGSIKVSVTLDEANVQTQAQKITQTIARATTTHGIGVSLNLDQRSVDRIRTELNNLRVDPNITRAMTEQLDQMGIQIDRITGRWEAVNGEQERMLNLTIQGTDQMGRTVTYLQTYDTETQQIDTTLTNVTANLERQRRAEEQLANQARADNESRISYLTRQQSILADIQASYVGATSVKPIRDESHLTELNNAYTAINAQIQNMINAEGRLDNVQRSALESQIRNLQRLAKEYQNAEYVATKLRTKDIVSIKADQLSNIEALENRLNAADTMTDSFRQKIEALKTALSNVTNKDQLVAFLNSFDQLNNDVSVFQERLRGVNSIYTQMIGVEKQITTVQNNMMKLDPKADENKLLALRGQLAVLESQRASLQDQLIPYADIVQYADRAKALEQSRLINGGQLVYSQMELADRAKEYDASMQRVNSTIADLETRMKQVVSPTETLKQNMQMLRETAAQYSSDMGDREKVQTYERLQGLISACRKEMSELTRVEHGEVLDVKFTQGLEKAKADLVTIGRQWSALKGDPGLNAQFQQLSENLKRIDNQMDLNKWTAQFSRFKSEVKATGKNMQSLGDVLKSNVGKVLQWVSATTLLFRAFRLLKTAVSTVIELDTAMIDLQKVTRATTEEYRQFYESANDTAKLLGVTTEEIISQTAEWARLGYAMKDAAKLAENSAIFEAISPDMDISMATDGLVSILKAFPEIDVEDSLDGIISKVNAVGNAFAVSNGDIIEALTRSSSAMAAANNTFDETVALATAAIEITRDAASVGNGLKTLSMRIRGYDEETEEFAGGVEELTGVIADLTKTASNTKGVSLFEPGDPDTYRSTYDILKDIADIWDEITDKNQAQLLEALFGKRQAQIGSAILSNFSQAEETIKTMAESAGSAEAEMDKIKQSLEYKLNELKETWVGVAQNLFDISSIGVVIDALTMLSEAFDGLTKHTGLFGSVSLVLLISQFAKLKSTMGTVSTAVLPIVNAIKSAGVAMDGSASSTQFYALKLMTLDKEQQAAAMSALKLSAEQRTQVANMQQCIASAQRYTIQELAEKAASDKATASTLAKNMAKATEKRTTEQLTVAMMSEILNSNKLTAAQKQAILTSLEQATANEVQAFSWKSVAANAKAAMAAMATNPVTWVTLAITLITGLVQAWQNYKQSVEEARQAAIDAGAAASTLSDEIVDLTTEYLSLSEAVKTDDSAKQNLLSTQDALIDKLGLEKGRIEELTAEYGNLTDAIKAAAAESLQNAERDLRGAYNAQKEQLLSDAKPSGGAGNSMNHITATWDSKSSDINRKGLQALVDAGYITDGSFARLGMELRLPDDGDFDLTTIEGVINAYDRLGEMIDIVADKAGSDNEVYDALYNAYNKCSSSIEAYRGSIASLNENLAEQYMLQGLIGKEVPNTQEKFDSYRQGVIEAAKASGEFIGTDQDIVNEIDSILQSQSEFANFYTNDLDTAASATTVYRANLEQLTDVLSELQSKYEALDAAKADMADGGGLSSDTIEQLASAEENYLDYLYEENGVIKLNTEAWEENANAKMQGQMGEIEKEIDSLKERNSELEKANKLLEIQRSLLMAESIASGADRTNEIKELTDQIEANTEEINTNTAAIESNQGKLAIYSSLFGSITGDLDAYTSALNNFSNIASSIDSVSSSFQTLANLQAEVANGFTMSLEKALEFAKVYPEILNSATMAADGQITLNEGVVNSFIEGKKAEIDAQIDSQIAQLEADKAVLQARMAFAQAQLDLAKAVGDGEGQITKELAEYRLNTANQLLAALIEAGVDEATAFQMAAAAMAGNAQEFDRIAAEVCTDVNGNFNSAAYAAAQAIYQNMNSAKQDVASLATQAQQTAAAIAGIAAGIQAGSAALVGGSGGGSYGNQIKINLSGANFQGTDYSYEAKEIGLDDFISDLELDISNYQSAIAQIDGQIAALQALKNTPLKSFQSGGGSGGSGGSGGGSGGSSKEIEEYIVDIDKYRKAVERLRKAQEKVENLETKIDDTGSFEDKITIEKQLIDAYKEEQEALHNLNDLRDNTIHGGVDALRALGFQVKYNADTNELWIENLEHLNELTADSKGKYNSLQEATNALRKDTESLINTITDLNKSNQEGSASWIELKKEILDAKVAICEFEAQVHDNSLTLMENWLDNAINSKDANEVKRYTTWMISQYRELQNVYKREADILRAAGYSDTSDEVSKLIDSWWDLEENIKDAKQKLVDYFIDITDAAHDAVDEIQNVASILSDAAQEFADNDGWISVDTYQDILQLGAEYMQMLIDENGLLVINRERVNSIIEAKTRQLAVEQALSYVERLRLAATGQSNENLDQLCFSTTQATNSTWGLVYAELALMKQTGLLNDTQYEAALHNIEAIQSLAETAVAGIGKTADAASEKMENLKKELEDQKDALKDLLDEIEDIKDGCDDLVKYVMDMLKDRIQQQIEALIDAKKAVKEYVDELKESMRAEKENSEYEDELAEKLKAIAKLQSKIDALSLDDSRKAQAEKAALEEELSGLQKELADYQADHALDVTEDALDKQYDAYEEEKDAEIDKLEESISSTQKLYDMAIQYIKDNWNTLYSELIDWNYEYGNNLNSEISAAWEAAQSAAQRYGDFITAIMGGLDDEIARITAQITELETKISNIKSSKGDSGSNGIPSETPNTVGKVDPSPGYSDADMVKAKKGAVKEIVAKMRTLGAQWFLADPARRKQLADEAFELGASLEPYGIEAERRGGTWYIIEDDLNPANNGKLLHECYHTGGYVGDDPLLPDEEYIKAKNGELILTSNQQDSIVGQIDRIEKIGDTLNDSISNMPVNSNNLLTHGMSGNSGNAVNNIIDKNQPIIQVKETITCVPEKSVEAHQKISRDMLNEIARQIRKP